MYAILSQYRTPEEIHDDEQKEIHDNEHDPDCPDPRCWRCEKRLEELVANLCRCGHDREDEHRVVGTFVLFCEVCDVECGRLGEREEFEAKVEAINAKAKPKVEAEVRKWADLEGAPFSHIEPKEFKSR